MKCLRFRALCDVLAPGAVRQQNIIVGTLLSALLIAPALAQIPPNAQVGRCLFSGA
jgi:hypothetical protein